MPCKTNFKKQLTLDYRNNKLQQDEGALRIDAYSGTAKSGRREFMSRAGKLSPGEMKQVLVQYFDRVVGLRLTENDLRQELDVSLTRLCWYALLRVCCAKVWRGIITHVLSFLFTMLPLFLSFFLNMQHYFASFLTIIYFCTLPSCGRWLLAGRLHGK